MQKPSVSARLPGLARRLADAGLADSAQLAALVEEAGKSQVSLVELLATRTKIPEDRLAQAASEEFGLPVFDLDAFDRELLPKEHLIEPLMRKHHALPLLQRGNRLHIAVSDPTNLSAGDEFKFATGLAIETLLVEHHKLERLIEDSLSAAMSMMNELDDDGFADLAISVGEEEQQQTDDTEGIDDAPVVRFVNKLMLDAIRRKASDIHLEPFEKDFRVRFRIDGMLYDVGHPPLTLAG
jgi:type IV pilus assembly protein PilB